MTKKRIKLNKFFEDLKMDYEDSHRFFYECVATNFNSYTWYTHEGYQKEHIKDMREFLTITTGNEYAVLEEGQYYLKRC